MAGVYWDVLRQDSNFKTLEMRGKEAQMGSLRFRVDAGKHPKDGPYVAVLLGSDAVAIRDAVVVARHFLPSETAARVYSRDQLSDLEEEIRQGRVRRVVLVRVRSAHSATELSALESRFTALRASGARVQVEAWDPRRPLQLARRLGQLWSSLFARTQLDPDASERFRLEDALLDLMQLMRAPSPKDETDRLRVTLIDDHPDDIVGLICLLEAWPGVDLEVVINDGPETARLLCPPRGEEVEPPEVLFDADVILVDEDMPDCFGVDIYTRWRKVIRACERPPLIASIRAQTAPAWFFPGWEARHFGWKHGVVESERRAREFIAFFTALLLQRKPHWSLPSVE